MSKIFDGTDDELTYEQAVVLMAQQISWPTESMQREVVRAVQKAKNLLPPEPEFVSAAGDARDYTIRQQEQELEQMRRELAQANERAELQAALRAAKEKELAAAQQDVAQEDGAAQAGHDVDK